MNSVDVIVQGFIVVTGVSALWLLASPVSGVRAVAGLIGMAGQPFWIYSTFQESQWGIFILALIYVWSWYRIFRNNRFQKRHHLNDD